MKRLHGGDKIKNTFLKARQLSAIVLTVTSLTAAVKPALAVDLPSGGSVVPPNTNYAALVVEDPTRTVVLTDAANVVLDTVTIRDRVTLLSTGTYSFERFIQNGPGFVAPHPTLGRYTFTESGFAGYSTSVDYDSTSGGSSFPATATRTATGNSVSFGSFSPTDTLIDGQRTDVMTDRTNATAYALVGTTTITCEVNGIPVSGSVATFAPIPEPASLGLLGLAGLSLLRRRQA
ncbi:MAG: hypothetical protein JWN51_2474 [Phycisphaerales bacterium]|nr:hypothetical protein [Phycisphaerales bacterium]